MKDAEHLNSTERDLYRTEVERTEEEDLAAVEESDDEALAALQDGKPEAATLAMLQEDAPHGLGEPEEEEPELDEQARMPGEVRTKRQVFHSASGVFQSNSWCLMAFNYAFILIRKSKSA